ncbi:MAG: xanthine dehydrogenase small subunit [Microbacteriaceae bacterium]|nr:xanthine dehydrogenase small subunit [Burkholderiaceae bacterium]
MSQAPSDLASPTFRPIRFVHQGRTVSVDGLPSTTSVLTWLREQAHCTGTKEGCNEGDCGACTVLVGSLQADGRVAYRPINSCIQFLPTLDGKALVTVEDLGGAHPAQQAMVACHGSQCGFCTPGFVMSLAACHQRHSAAGTVPSRQQIADDLSGNLCRCTGYRPILDAGQQMFSLPNPQPLDDDTQSATAQALAALQAAPPLHYNADTPFHAPRSLAALAALRLTKPEARLLAGSTDVGLWVNKQFRALGELVYLGEVAELKVISEADGCLQIGAGASLAVAWAALAAHWSAAREMGQRFASLPIREAGTMGGNIANGSPIGDSAPVLIALGAQIVLRRGDLQRTLALQEFYLDYMKNQLQPGEFVEALRLPLPAPGDTLRVYKLSKRHDCDISSLAAGLWLNLAGDNLAGDEAASTGMAGTAVVDARFAFGGLAGTVKRAAAAEAAVRGRPWTHDTVQRAMVALDHDFQPLSDLRASASYRRRSARNLLLRLWLETRAEAPLAANQVSVWSFK